MATIFEALTLGRQHHLSGNLAGAVQIYQQILHADATQVDAWYLLASALQSLGNLTQAEQCYRQAARLRPGHAETYNGLGIVLSLSGRPHESVASFQETLRLQPTHFQALNNLGNVLRDLGRLAEAEECCRAALRLKPDYPEAYNNLGNALKDLGRLDEAVACLREAIRLRPNYARAFNNLGAALASQRRFDEAIRCYQESLRLQPDLFQAYNNLGVTYAELRQMDKAAACYQEAIRLRPDFADAYNNLGIALQELWRLDEAMTFYQKAIHYRHAFPDAHNQIGMVLMAQGKIEPAVAAYRKALELKPDDAKVHSNLLLCMNYLPDLSPDELYAEHLRWNERHGNIARLGPAADHDRNPNRKLRIGYMSPDFRKHAVTYFFESILANHDPAIVESICYAHVANPDSMTDRLRTLASHWHFVTYDKDAEIARQIMSDRVDILVDLAGHAGNKRMQVLAHKPAPIIVTYVGYPNTTGMSAVDYRLTDAVADPPGAATHCTEDLVRLPHFCCYTPPVEAPEVTPLPCLRNGFFTFGSVHGLPKLNRHVFDVWTQLLVACPNSKLFLHRSVLTGETQNDLVREFTKRGVDRDRILAGHEADPQCGYLRLYEHIDLCLDAFPYGGHTTMCESLWMGVPVVTMRGARFAGRVTASVLTSAGLSEFIAETPDDYIALAVRWARLPDRLAQLRGHLRQQLRASALLDGRRFTRELEAAYRTMWRRWCLTDKA